MLRNLFLLAGLGAALISGAVLAAAATAAPDRSQSIWLEQHVEAVSPGSAYRVDVCLSVSSPGVEWLSLRVAWYSQSGGFGPTLFQQDQPADPWVLGEEQCVSLWGAQAPCAALSARYGVAGTGSLAGVVISHLQFSPDPAATPVACAAPTATPAPIPTITATPLPTRPPHATPTGTPNGKPTPALKEEPDVFPALVNGGFETLRADGTPYGWRKTGGEISASAAARAEGSRSLALTSATTATKWAYQTVSVTGGRYYRATAFSLTNDSNAKEALLRLSWYESPDGGGSQMATSDSPAMETGSPQFQLLDTGAVQAPPGARSAKLRLMLRPASAGRAVAYFDSARFAETGAPAPAQEASVAPGPQENDRQDPSPALSSSGAGPAAVVWGGRTPLANVKAVEASDDSVASSGHDTPVWPLLLALGIPALGLCAAGGHAWARGRQARGNGL